MFEDLEHCGDLLTRNARKYGREIGIVFGDVRLTWGEVNARANRFAQALGRLGVRQGERICILSENCHQFVEVLFGLAKIGVVSVPINYRLSESEVEYIVVNAEATALIVGEKYLQTGRSIFRRVKQLRLLIIIAHHGNEREPGVIGYEELVAEGATDEPQPERKIAPDDVLMLMYTSGTTGFPKGAVWAHRSMLVGMFTHLHAIGARRGLRVMLPSPLYSTAGIAGIYCWTYVGAYIVLINFAPELALETIERERINFTNLVPTTIHMLANHPDRHKYDLSSLRTILYGGAPMPLPVILRAMEVFHWCEFRQTYATTETGCAGTVLEPWEHTRDGTERSLRRLQSCGREQMNVRVRVVDEQGQDVPPGEVGEIIVRSEANMKGYWKLPKETEETIREGYIYTGDLATVDEDGFVYIVDRKKDMIVSGALNIYPSEVERVLYEHPAVQEAAVIGVPDEKWGEAVKAVVVLKPGTRASEEELIAFCKQRIAGFKAPKSVEFMECLPRTPTGKLLRRELRERYWQGRDRKV